jgi:hypothetical protein
MFLLFVIEDMMDLLYCSVILLILSMSAWEYNSACVYCLYYVSASMYEPLYNIYSSTCSGINI